MMESDPDLGTPQGDRLDIHATLLSAGCHPQREPANPVRGSVPAACWPGGRGCDEWVTSLRQFVTRAAVTKGCFLEDTQPESLRDVAQRGAR